MENPLEHLPVEELQAQVLVTEYDVKSATQYLQELTSELIRRNVSYDAS